MSLSVSDQMSAIARELLPMTDEIADEVTERLLRDVPELTPSRSAEELRLVQTSTRQNTGAILATLAFGITSSSMEPPQGTVDLLSTILDAGGDAADLMRGYHVGHDQLWRHWAQQVRGRCAPEAALEILEMSSEHLFTFVDRACLDVLKNARSTESTERMSTVTSDVIRALLNGDIVEPDFGSRALRHPIADVHVALVCTPLAAGGPAREELQRIITTSGVPALLVPGDDGAWCAWLRWAHQPAAEALEIIAAEPVVDVLIGMGEPLVGHDGFRRSHEQARAAVALGQLAVRPIPTVLRHRAVDVVAALCANPAAALRLVEDRLGPLTARDETAARLRATIRSLLRHGHNRAQAAKELAVHHKTVTYRIAQAEAMLGRSLAEDTIGIEVALLIDEALYGP